MTHICIYDTLIEIHPYHCLSLGPSVKLVTSNSEYLTKLQHQLGLQGDDCEGRENYQYKVNDFANFMGYKGFERSKAVRIPPESPHSGKSSPGLSLASRDLAESVGRDPFMCVGICLFTTRGLAGQSYWTR